jgi:coenzyme F420-reducing hydrogenase alpha subunit
LEVLGGRAIHPINVAVGGFYRLPKPDALQRLIPHFEWGLQAAIDTTRWVAGFDFPDFSTNYELVSLSHEHEYPMNEGCIATNQSEAIAVHDYENYFEELHVPQSTALHSLRKPQGTSYLVGPLARILLNANRLSPTALQIYQELNVPWHNHNLFHSIIARGLELIHAFEEALEILRHYRQPATSRVAYTYREGEGSAATEAPRGLLYHRYRIDGAGKIMEAKIVPPTSQNQAQIEADLRYWVPRFLHGDDATLARNCENLVRCYDPCISCSTHFLKVKIDR